MSESGYSSDEYENETFYKSEMKNFKSSYEVCSLVMMSANGKIYVGKEKETGNDVIIKILPRKSNLTWVGDRRVPREVKYHFIAAGVDEGSVQILDFYERKKDFILVLEKPENSIDLLEFTNHYGPLDFKMAKSICKQLAISSLAHQSAGICHRDLKDENVLFNPSNGQVKIIDFGCATVHQDAYTTYAGTHAYAPPEFRLTGSMNSDKMTSYHIGCLLFTILTRSCPFSENSDFDFEKFVTLNSKLSFEERGLLSTLLQPNPESRMSLSDLSNL